MGEEKRKSKRTNIDVQIFLRQFDDKYVSGLSSKSVVVNVINISKDGIAFTSDMLFRENTYYDTRITLDNKETIDAVIEVVRADKTPVICTYGCRFIGINSVDQKRIETFQLLEETE
ncbi:MAG: PilZ domain-containing protein [Lachnospira sp.]